jgi:hypothetical protein
MPGLRLARTEAARRLRVEQASEDRALLVASRERTFAWPHRTWMLINLYNMRRVSEAGRQINMYVIISLDFDA